MITFQEIGADVQKQMKEKEDALRNRYDATDDYNKQVSEQLDKLVKHKELTDAQARRLNLKDLQGQIEYNKVLKVKKWLEIYAHRSYTADIIGQYLDDRAFAQYFFSFSRNES